MSDVLIRLVGTYVDAANEPMSGRVTVFPVVQHVNAQTKRFVTQRQVAGALDVDGQIILDVVASDDPDWYGGETIRYMVVEHLAGLDPHRYEVTLPSAGGLVDLADLQPVTA